ncbi:hypothetical protein WN944_008406 [Citrus x changshan-huyou]|uniref:Uncharacterized protein n=1 Tax=Citrus x changshan-huyou TaxID=2935761 RepID=A0AAP0MQI2_9ROSI
MRNLVALTIGFGLIILHYNAKKKKKKGKEKRCLTLFIYIFLAFQSICGLFCSFIIFHLNISNHKLQYNLTIGLSQLDKFSNLFQFCLCRRFCCQIG